MSRGGSHIGALLIDHVGYAIANIRERNMQTSLPRLKGPSTLYKAIDLLALSSCQF